MEFVVQVYYYIYNNITRYNNDLPEMISSGSLTESASRYHYNACTI